MAKYRSYGMEAESMYIRKNKKCTEIGELLGISWRTIERWKRKYNWEEKRLEYNKTARGAIEVIETLLHEKLDDFVKKEDITLKDIKGFADAISKIVASLEKLRKTTDLRTQVITVMTEFSSYIKKINLKVGQIEFVTKLVQGFFDYTRDR